MKSILQKIDNDIYKFVDEHVSRDEHVHRIAKAYEDVDFSDLDAIKEKIKNKEIDNVVFAGMGSSMYALTETELVFLTNGLRVSTYEASKAAMYAEHIINKNTLLIVVSQSGTSPEVLDLLAKVDKDSHIIGITNNLDTPMGAVKPVFEIHADKEYYIAHNSYVNTLYVLSKVANYLLDIVDTLNADDIVELLSVQDEYITSNWDNVFNVFEEVTSIDFITHADHVGTGRNTTLLCREGLGVMTNTFTINEYYHGEHLVNNNNKLTVFIDVYPEDEDKAIMQDIEAVNNNNYLFINYKEMYGETTYENYTHVKPIVQMALFNRIVEQCMSNLNKNQ